MPNIPVLYLSPLLSDHIEIVMRDKQQINLDIGGISDVEKAYFQNNIPFTLQKQFSEVISSNLNNPDTGFIIIRNVFKNELTIQENLSRCTILCSLIGTPFKVISSSKLWNQLTVNPLKKEYESEGSGYNCLHIDVPNTSIIPPIACLVCERPHIHGGGETILSNIKSVFNHLTEYEIRLCYKEQFFEGMHYNLINVGEKYLPFPIIKHTENGKLEFRFSGKMKFDDRNELHYSLIEKIEKILLNNSINFLLERGEMLLINQSFVTHGRQALMGDLERIPEHEKRSIFQTKMKLDSQI